MRNRAVAHQGDCLGRMCCTVQRRDNRIEISLRGDIGTREAELLQRHLNSSLPVEQGQEVVIDLDGLNYLGGAGIGTILALYKKITANRGVFHLTNIPGPIYHLLRELRLDTLFALSPRQ
ncbi:STAS domain-containing protein [Desulfurivibrio alkaliphilus]|uniref:STAS domain-containing protein n=1 Tax=Desulfurivibrio alkaliphilus TaxID=427923 RepID=UPI0001B3F3FC|nr:STAS domain-containing protein [Desulfurivibrio alkaliphilus]